jgi:hypothetical protein
MPKAVITVDETNAPELPLSILSCDDADLQTLLVRQTLTRATHARVLKLKTLVRVLTRCGELLADELASAVGCSGNAVRKHIRQLQDLEVIEVARYEPLHGLKEGRPVYRLGPNKGRAEAILVWGAIEPKKKFTELRPARFTETHLGRIHILEDDLPHHYQPSSTKHSRDPLVAALFGDA